jgi:predicted esterase
VREHNPFPFVFSAVLAVFLIVSSAGRAENKRIGQYRGLVAQCKADDAESHYRLAKWCRRNHLPILARKHLRLAVKIDPGHKGARRALGHVKVQNDWYAPEQAETAKARLKYRGRREKADFKDVKAILALAKFAERNHLRAEIRECYEAVLGLEPDNKEARAGLHFLFLNGKWVGRKEWEGRYFSQPDEKACSEFYRVLEAAGWKGGEHELKTRRRWSRSPRGRSEQRPLKEPDRFPTGAYLLITPQEIDIERRYPLMIALHGNPGKGKWIANFYCPRGTEKGYILAFPDSLIPTTGGRETAHEWTRAESESYVLALIEEIRRDYPVDPARIFLAGISMGGEGCWNLGTKHPEIFAGIAPFCSNPGDAKLENCKELAVFFAHGDKDTNLPVECSRRAARTLENLGYDFTYDELPGVGHAIPKVIYEKIYEIFESVRHPHPGKK